MSNIEETYLSELIIQAQDRDPEAIAELIVLENGYTGKADKYLAEIPAFFTHMAAKLYIKDEALQEAVVYELDVYEERKPSVESPEPLEAKERILGMKWYRGLSQYSDDPTINSRNSSYMVTITSSIKQALSYAGEDGYVSEVKFTDEMRLKEFVSQTKGIFSPVAFDRESKELRRDQAMFVDGVYDFGFHQTDTLETNKPEPSMNIALNPNTEVLELVRQVPAMEMVKELKAMDAKPKHLKPKF